MPRTDTSSLSKLRDKFSRSYFYKIPSWVTTLWLHCNLHAEVGTPSAHSHKHVWFKTKTQ